MLQLIYLILAIITPLTYDVIMHYSGSIIASFVNLDDWGYFSVDAIICAIMLLVYIPWYLSLKNKPRKDENHKTIVPKGYNWIVYTIMTLGMAKIADIWFTIANILATQNQAISDSFESFDETWATVDQEPYFWVFLSVVLLGPLVEEFIFRGIVYNYMDRFGGVLFAIIFSGVAFGIWHGELVQMVYTGFMGIVLAIVYRYTKSLWVVSYMHILNNFLTTLPDVPNVGIYYDIIYIASGLCFIPMLVFAFVMAKRIYQESKLEEVTQSDVVI